MRLGLRAVGAALLIAAVNAVPSVAAEPDPRANVTIHVDQPGAIIDRHIYGQFAEHLGHGIYGGVWVGEQSAIPNERGFRKDVIAALKQLKVPVVRWPGGCFADEYHWRDGIGPRNRRPTTVNTNWGGVPESNEFGTHEFMDFVELIGADAYINGNLGTGTPREMSEWLQYLTSDQETAITAERARNGHPKPWKIAYFAVGNESWGCGGNMSVDYYIDLFRQYLTFLKTPPGARPQIIASGSHDTDTTWSDTIAAKAAEGVNAVSFHYYTLPGVAWQHKGASVGFGESEWISTLAHTLVMDDFIKHNVAMLQRHDPDNKIALAVDEWGTWYDPEPGRDPGFLYQQNTLRDALVAAINLNIFHQHADRVRLANIAQMVNVLQAMILTNGRGDGADAHLPRVRTFPAIPRRHIAAQRSADPELRSRQAERACAERLRGTRCERRHRRGVGQSGPASCAWRGLHAAGLYSAQGERQHFERRGHGCTQHF